MPIDESRFAHLRSNRAQIVAHAPGIEDWPGPTLQDLLEEDRIRFLNSRRAVQLWVAGAPAKEIRRNTSMTTDASRRLAERCVRLNPKTRTIFGFWACLPGFRGPTQPRHRYRAFNSAYVKVGKGLAGALQDVFRRYPGIEKKLHDFVTTRMESGAAPVPILTIANIYDRFIALCKDFGLRERREWPFTAKRCGYEAVRRWYKKFRHEVPARTIRNEYGDAAVSIDRIDRQISNVPKSKAAYLAYERVELDEHHEDGRWSIMTPVAHNQFSWVAAARLHALVMRDVGSKVALACGISYRERYAIADILRLVHAALVPPPRKSLFVANSHFRYDPEACFPAELPGFEKLTWQVLAMDADRAHFSAHVLESLALDIGCHVYGERIGTPTARYSIEGFFKLIADMCENLPSATGNRPDSAARRDPDKAAKRWNIVAPLAEQLLDLKCRNYNVTPSAECEGLSPIQRLQEMFALKKRYRCPLGELRQANLYRFLPRYEANLTRRRGASSLSPFGVNLFGGRYVGPELSEDVELSFCGVTAVTVYVQEDACHAFVVPKAFPDRAYPVVLTGAYSDMAHTLEWRRLAYAYRKNMHIKGKVSTYNLMVGMLRGLGAAAKSDNAVASLLSGVTAFMDRNGRGDTTYVDLPTEKREALSEYARKIAEADEAEGFNDDDLEYPSTPGAARTTDEVRPPGSAPKGRANDPFGLL